MSPPSDGLALRSSSPLRRQGSRLGRMLPAPPLLVVACLLACSAAAAAPCDVFAGGGPDRAAAPCAALDEAVSTAALGAPVCFQASKHLCSFSLMNESLTIATGGDMGGRVIDYGGLARFAELRSPSSPYLSPSGTIALLVLRHGSAEVRALIHALHVSDPFCMLSSVSLFFCSVFPSWLTPAPTEPYCGSPISPCSDLPLSLCYSSAAQLLMMLQVG